MSGEDAAADMGIACAKLVHDPTTSCEKRGDTGAQNIDLALCDFTGVMSKSARMLPLRKIDRRNMT